VSWGRWDSLEGPEGNRAGKKEHRSSKRGSNKVVRTDTDQPDMLVLMEGNWVVEELEDHIRVDHPRAVGKLRRHF